ncbi:MAG: hypothetical protein GX024_06950 [Clostridiales bacterium]|nr:hypothetical protein [Clostridiales bacterium]
MQLIDNVIPELVTVESNISRKKFRKNWARLSRRFIMSTRLYIHGTCMMKREIE